MKRILLSCILLVAAHHSYCQRERIDSLLGVIDKEVPDSVMMKSYYLLSKDYVHISGDSSSLFANKALVMAQKVNDLKVQGDCYSVLGVNEKNKGDFEKALDWQLKALRIREKNKDERGLATTYNDIGVIYKVLNKYDEALKYYTKSNEICRKINLSKGISMTYNNIGTIYRAKVKPDSALIYYQLALKEAEKTGDGYSISTCLSNIGDIYADKDNHVAALSLFQRCLEIDRANQDKPGMVVSYNNVARGLASLKRFPEAIKYSDSALALCYTENLNQERIYAYSIRINVEEGRGNYSEALKHFRSLVALKDSLMGEETAGKMAELQTKYETEKKENKIALQQSEIGRKNYLLGGVLGVLGLGLLLSFSYYKRSKLEQQAKLQAAIIEQQELATFAVIEAEERERKRIAGDLHDGVGQLMSAAKMNLSMVGSEMSFSNEEQRQSFEKAMALVDEGCKEVRTVSHQIMPNALLKSGLASAIREFISKLDQRVIKVHLYSEGLNDRIDGNVETVLYRVVQECVNNVIKHSGADHLDISLIREEQELSVTIEDNGKGFDTSDRSKFNGIGIKNIQSRVEYLKGNVEWDSAPGKGTVVAIHIPLKNAPSVN
jgi:two-component system, NarL family, sensor kinase